MTKIEILNTSDNPLPAYAREGDAGMDLRAADTWPLMPGRQRVIRTGVRIAIPEGYVGLVWPRSGLAVKHGIDVLAGVIDSSYRGEIGVVLINHGAAPLLVMTGDRIAQLLIQPVIRAELVPVEELSETVRGHGGFGSTGSR